MRRRLFAGLLGSLTLLAAGSCSDRYDARSDFLDSAWAAYLQDYVHPDGFVLDRRRDGGRVTSEGQGYALLRALWERDEDAFRRIATWTRSHLQRPDGLHSWLWTPENGGRIVDANSATDGDMEIAWALLMAADVFGDDEFRVRGTEIVRAVRTRTGIRFGADIATPPGAEGSWFPGAGDWAVDERIINLSYFVPYAHPWFHAVDPAGGWEQVTEVGYDILDDWMSDPSHRLPPAFIQLQPDGRVRPLASDTELETEFSFDAIRLYWRVEADCRLRRSTRACDDPLDVRATVDLLADPSGIASSYSMDGTRLTEAQSTTFYAALLPAARRLAPESATGVLEPRLDAAALTPLLTARDRYYDHNWVWFGLALDRGWLEERTPAQPVN